MLRSSGFGVDFAGNSSGSGSEVPVSGGPEGSEALVWSCSLCSLLFKG